MRTLTVLVLIVLSGCSLRTSQVAVGACSGLDAARSWGQPEAIPYMQDSQGNFSSRGAVIKGATFGGLVATQQPLKHRRWVKWMNYSLAGAYCTAAMVRR